METANDEAPRSPSGPRLDRRTVTICVAIATVAALVSALVALALLRTDQGATADGSPDPNGLTPAKQAPDTALTRFDGSTVKLSDYRGQKLLVNFFASTCVPCKNEMPALQRVLQRLGDDVTFLGIAVQDDPEAAQELVEKTGVTYDLAQDRAGTLLRQIGGVGLPTTAFIAEDGTVMDLNTGELTEQELTQEISDNLLAGG